MMVPFVCSLSMRESSKYLFSARQTQRVLVEIMETAKTAGTEMGRTETTESVDARGAFCDTYGRWKGRLAERRL